MVAASPKVAAPAKRRQEFQSRVSTGKDILPGVDNRSALARRFRDISFQVIADQGGSDAIAEVRLQLIRRFSAAAVLAEAMEARLANGEKVDVMEHAALTSSMVRVASRIGIGRRARDLTPTLAKYLEGRQTPEEDDDNSPAD